MIRAHNISACKSCSFCGARSRALSTLANALRCISVETKGPLYAGKLSPPSNTPEVTELQIKRWCVIIMALRREEVRRREKSEGMSR